MAEEFYQLPESPVYNAETIRKIQDTDPVRASTIVNPVISRLIENTHAVKKLADKAQQEAASAAAAEEYSSESVYNAGSYCTRGGKLYKANQDILSAEPWTEAHWTETNIAAELVAIYTALSNKAPGGYGLGTAATNIPDLNDATKNGWYMNGAGGEAVHAPDNVPGWLVLVCAYADEIVFQTAYRYGSDEGLISARRAHHNLLGGWQPWEWVNPPMQLGVEYRTTERYSNKPVFVMAVDGGVFPDSSSKTIDVQIPDTSGRVKMLDCYGVLDNGTQIPGLFGESVFNASNYLGLFTQNGNGKFTISVGSGRTVGLNFTLFLKYWKEGT